MTLALGLHAALPIQVTAHETEDLANMRMRVDIRVIDDVLVSCEIETEKFCSTVTPGEGRVLMCVLAYEDKISQRCGTAVFDALVELGDMINNMQFAVEACRGDIEKTCGNVEPGGGRVAQCLIDNIATISEPCQKSVARFR
jgi:Golgi apparatus protein 1